MTMVFESYSLALHAEFFDDTTDSSFEDNDEYILEIALSSETSFGSDIDLEIQTLMEGNDRSDLALLKIPTIFEDDEPVDSQFELESAKNYDNGNKSEPKPQETQNIKKSSAYAVDAVRIGHTERRRSIGNSAA